MPLGGRLRTVYCMATMVADVFLKVCPMLFNIRPIGRDAINRVRAGKGDFDMLRACHSANNTLAYADATCRVPTSDEEQF